MELERGDAELEALNARLNSDIELRAYKAVHDGYRVSLLPRLLGAFFIASGNALYGKEPGYLKFRAIEVIARVPYHSWASAAYTLLTLHYRDERRALRYSKTARFAALAQENETMHVVVVSHLARTHERAGFFRHTFVPVWFAFFYFWWSYVLYLVNPRYSYELNYLFEGHAFEQYARFVERHSTELRERPVHSEFLRWYGRHPHNQYEFFRSVRNDEIIHRNRSIEEIQSLV